MKTLSINTENMSANAQTAIANTSNFTAKVGEKVFTFVAKQLQTGMMHSSYQAAKCRAKHMDISIEDASVHISDLLDKHETLVAERIAASKLKSDKRRMIIEEKRRVIAQMAEREAELALERDLLKQASEKRVNEAFPTLAPKIEVTPAV